MELKFRELKANEIELRVGSTNENGFQLLLYKDARVDMALLDEVVGKGNWQREHKILGNDIYCRVGIYNKDLGCWVWVEDAGSSGNIEVEKSKASDSFKRACVNLGIGRALYSAPFVWITKDQYNDPKKSHYLVSEIEYSNGEISKLVIINEKTKQVVYSCGSQYKVSKNADLTPQTPKQDSKPVASSVKGSIREEEKKYINGYLNVCSDQDSVSFYNLIKQRFSAHSIDDLSAEQGIVVVKSLKRKLGE